jgi:hypothetical protein
MRAGIITTNQLMILADAKTMATHQRSEQLISEMELIFHAVMGDKRLEYRSWFSSWAWALLPLAIQI